MSLAFLHSRYVGYTPSAHGTLSRRHHRTIVPSPSRMRWPDGSFVRAGAMPGFDVPGWTSGRVGVKELTGSGSGNPCKNTIKRTQEPRRFGNVRGRRHCKVRSGLFCEIVQRMNIHGPGSILDRRVAEPIRVVRSTISLHLMVEVVVCVTTHRDGIHKDLQQSFSIQRFTGDRGSRSQQPRMDLWRHQNLRLYHQWEAK